MSYNVWVDVVAASSAVFTYIPSPVRGGNLGFIVGVERGADLWMKGRGEDGVVRHEMTSQTTYDVGAELSSDVVCLVGPIGTTLEVLGHVATRSIGPLKTFVNMFESGFWVFGDEGEVRATARGTLIGDHGKLVNRHAAAGSRTARFELPQGNGRPVPPLDAPAREREEIYGIEHYMVPGGQKHMETAPHRVRSTIALEVLESGFPGGANAAGEVEARHVVDLMLQLRQGSGATAFLRWSSAAGFDDASRAQLAPAARKKDDAMKERIAREREARTHQEKAYLVQEDRLRGLAAGEGADARREAEIQAFLTEAEELHLPEEAARARVEEIKRAYDEKARESARQRRHLEQIARVVQERWDAALQSSKVPDVSVSVPVPVPVPVPVSVSVPDLVPAAVLVTAAPP